MEKHTEIIERIYIAGPMAESDEVFDFLREGDYRITLSRPRRIGARRCDTSQFEIIAERNVPESQVLVNEKELLKASVEIIKAFDQCSAKKGMKHCHASTTRRCVEFDNCHLRKAHFYLQRKDSK